MYFNKKFITSKPTKKLANTPIINGTLNTKSLNFSTVAAKTIGVDNKNEYFRFMPVQATGQLDDDNVEYFGDVYTAKFLASFAQVAQEQRHRTLRVKINFAGDKPGEYGYYVPELLQEQSLQEEWLPESQSSSRREC